MKDYSKVVLEIMLFHNLTDMISENKRRIYRVFFASLIDNILYFRYSLYISRYNFEMLHFQCQFLLLFSVCFIRGQIDDCELIVTFSYDFHNNIFIVQLQPSGIGCVSDDGRRM